MANIETSNTAIIPIEFSPHVAREILDAALSIPDGLSHEIASEKAKKLGSELSGQIIEDIEPILKHDSYAYIVGSPILDTSAMSLERATNVSRVLACSLGMAVGRLMTNPYENNGAPVSIVEVVEGLENAVSFNGGGRERLHKDTHGKTINDWVMLSMVRPGAKPTPTKVASTEAGIKLLPSEARAELAKSTYYWDQFDAEKVAGIAQEERKLEPILFEDGTVSNDHDDKLSITDAGQKANDLLEAALEEVGVDVFLNPGQTVVIQNKEDVGGKNGASHGRNQIHPTNKGDDRRRQVRAHADNPS